MPEHGFPFEQGDQFIRRVTRWNRNKSGRPSRSAFIGRDNLTSVFLERLLNEPVIPESFQDDILAFIPVEWLFRPEITVTPLDVKYSSGAHFDIVGKIHIEFADYLRDHAKRSSYSEWVRSWPRKNL